MKREYPTMKGFTRRGIYRMKQFYETYKDNEFVSTLLTQISWSNNVKILSSTCILYATGYPCPMCLSAIIWANIKTVYYATDLEDAEKIGFRDGFIYDYLKNKDSGILKLQQINRNDAISLFNEYQEKDKVIY